jgi:hypothetical protein
MSRYIVEQDLVRLTTEATMVPGSNMRVGDAEREAVASQLREHYADGRLTLDELNERIDQAFAARTRADLDALMRDLPTAPRPLVGSGVADSGSSGSSEWNDAPGAGPGFRPFAAAAPLMTIVWLCVILGSVFLFGHGQKPIAVVIILAAIAFLRRLFGVRRRGRPRGRGPHGRRRDYF